MRLASWRVTTARRKGVSLLMTSSIACSIVREVLLGEAAAGLVEVVVEAVLDRGADGHLGAREEALHGVGHDVGGRVADDRQAVGIGGADGREVARPPRRPACAGRPCGRASLTAMTSLSSLPAAERISRGVFRSAMGEGPYSPPEATCSLRADWAPRKADCPRCAGRERPLAALADDRRVGAMARRLGRRSGCTARRAAASPCRTSRWSRSPLQPAGPRQLWSMRHWPPLHVTTIHPSGVHSGESAPVLQGFPR